MKFFRFGLVVSALLCILMVSAFAAEPEYTYEFSDTSFSPEYATISYDGDMISVYVEDAFFEKLGVSRSTGLMLLASVPWDLWSVDAVDSSSLNLDWTNGSFSFAYVGDGQYALFSDRSDIYFSVNVSRVPVSSDSASVPGILSVVSDVFAAVLGLVVLLAAAFAVHPILLIGVVFGLLGIAIAIFRRLFV